MPTFCHCPTVSTVTSLTRWENRVSLDPIVRVRKVSALTPLSRWENSVSLDPIIKVRKRCPHCQGEKTVSTVTTLTRSDSIVSALLLRLKNYAIGDLIGKGEKAVSTMTTLTKSDSIVSTSLLRWKKLCQWWLHWERCVNHDHIDKVR